MKTIDLRPYQRDIINKLDNEFTSGEKEVVVAACPSSGKTIMMLSFMQSKPNYTFLVLTHGTLVLKDQWEREFVEHGLPASSILNKERITYGIPQSLHKKQLTSVDYLIVDEAHEFTRAEMVSTIKSKLRAKHIIYLTGTPSSFIRQGLKVLSIPAIDLINQNYIADLYVGMVSTNAQLEDKDYNRDGNLNDSKTKTLENNVTSDLDNLLKAMHKRLCESEAFKGNPQARRLVEWAPTLGKLHKTMIACRSIKQALKVEQYFTKVGISITSSNSTNDPDSLNIKAFQTNPDIKILVVVDRGVLGFNMPELVNVVDLTCSRNIDRIYQLYARAMRKNDKYPKKYFFKFSDENHMLLMKFYMNAALCLMFPDFINKYNGRNLNGMELPVLVKKETKEVKQKDEAREAKEAKEATSWRPIDPLFYESVTAATLLNDIWNRVDNEVNEYAFTTFGEIRKKEFNMINRDSEGKKLKLLDLATMGVERPNQRSHKLGPVLCSYVNPNHGSYDAIFTSSLTSIAPHWFKKTKEERLQELKEFCETYKRYPATSGTLPNETLIARNLDKTLKEYRSEILHLKKLYGWRARLKRSVDEFCLILPEHLKLISKCNSLKDKGEFMDEDYGLFTALLYNVKLTIDKGGIVGHPRRPKATIYTRRSIRRSDGKIYLSIADALREGFSGVNHALKSNKMYKGYLWTYCDENGNIID